MEIPKIWPIVSRLSGSLKVIGTDIDRLATYDFLLVFHSNYGPISYTMFEIKGDICPVSHPLYLTPPLRVFLLEFCNGSEGWKTRMAPYKNVKSVICPVV